MRKRFTHELSLLRMERCFRYFDKIQYDLQKGAILMIIRHMKKYTARRKAEREQEALRGKSKDSKKKGTKGTTPHTNKTATHKDTNSGKRGSISKTSRQTANSQKTGSAQSSQPQPAGQSKKSMAAPSL